MEWLFRRDLYYCFGGFLSVLFGVFSLTDGVVFLLVLYMNLLNCLVDLSFGHSSITLIQLSLLSAHFGLVGCFSMGFVTEVGS